MSALLDAPLQYALRVGGSCSQLPVNLNWVKCPPDAFAVTSMLSAGLLDMAIMFTEDAVAIAGSGGNVRICGTFLATPRTWGVYVPKSVAEVRKCEELKDCTVGIPDEAGGPLMAAVFGDSPGWENFPQLHRRTFCSIRRACDYVGRDLVKAVIWEKREAKPLVDCNTWKMVREEPMPWSGMVFVASREALYAKAASIKNFIHFAQCACVEFKDSGNTEALGFLKRYYLTAPDALDWISDTAWPCECEVDEAGLVTCLDYLKATGLLLPERSSEPGRLLAKEICRVSSLGSCHAQPVKMRNQQHPDELDEDFGLPPEPMSSSLAMEQSESSRAIGGPAATTSADVDFEPRPAG